MSAEHEMAKRMEEWKARAQTAEAEVARLREALENIAFMHHGDGDPCRATERARAAQPPGWNQTSKVSEALKELTATPKEVAPRPGFACVRCQRVIIGQAPHDLCPMCFGQ